MQKILRLAPRQVEALRFHELKRNTIVETVIAGTEGLPEMQPQISLAPDCTQIILTYPDTETPKE